MVTFLVSVKLHSICDQLLVRDIFENEEVRLILVVEVVALRLVRCVEETVGAPVRAAHG